MTTAAGIMAEEKFSFEQTYTFNQLSSKSFTFEQDRETSQLLLKWSMLGRITAQSFSFDQPFQPYRKNDFAMNFFQDPCVRKNLKVLDASGTWTALGCHDITHVNVEAVPCTKVSVDIFDPLYSNEVVRQSGHIIKCLNEKYCDFDELRMVLLEEDSNKYDVISPTDRLEFLFRLFKHLVIGGELCQYEDIIDPYIDTAKLIYKDMVSVRKDPKTKKISVVSTVLKVSACDRGGLCYPSANNNNEQTFAYFCIDPFRKQVHVLYHSFGLGEIPKY